MEPTLQPQSGAVPPTRPKNWLVESILVTIFCCLPFGIVGIIFAAQVNSKFDGGDYPGALKASKDAGKWTKIGFFVGIAVIVIGLIIEFSFFSFFSMRGH
ncbi:MAG TPA: CD225/dispanin family protein [Chitinophagaceae bacterium]|jgi:hypothetical protein|nr:CD225/dispanin family protein [Chitinophagaceae bacterium]